MANGVNKVILIGRLGADPEVRYTSNGGAVANFRLATNETWVDKSGQKQERTEWHKVVVWGKLGELCGQYLTKGRQAYVEGRLQTKEWEKDGTKRYTTEVVAQNIQFLGSPGEKGALAAEASSGGGDSSTGPEFESPGPEFETKSGSEDEVPF